MRRRESQQSLEENRIWSLCFYDKIKELRRGVLMHLVLPLVKSAQARVRRVCRPVVEGNVGGMDRIRSALSMVNIMHLVFSV